AGENRAGSAAGAGSGGAAVAVEMETLGAASGGGGAALHALMRPRSTTPGFIRTPYLLLVAESLCGPEVRRVHARDDGGHQADDDGQAAGDGELLPAHLHRQLRDEVDLGIEGEAVD